jgi:hypothetical protein
MNTRRMRTLMLFLKTTVRNNVFCARFYCALLTICFGPDRWPSSGNTYIKYTKATTDPLTYTVVALVYFMYVLHEDGHRLEAETYSK